MRLGGWRRIGIVLSVLWFFGFGLFLWSFENSRILDFYSFQMKNCLTILNMANEDVGVRPKLDGKDKFDEWDRRWATNWAKYEKCQDEARKFHQKQADDLVQVGLPPILLAIDVETLFLGWLFVWGVTAVVRWVHRSFVSG